MTPEISQLFEFCLYSHDDEYPGLPLAQALQYIHFSEQLEDKDVVLFKLAPL